MAAYTTIDDPGLYFEVQLRSGLYGGSDTAFNIGFQPDMIWDKKRSGTGVHSLFDSVRGFGASGKVLYPHTNDDEVTNALIDSVSSTGYTITASSDDTGDMVDWCWKESATAGFDIISYAGNATNRTIAHNLSAVPHVMLIKSRGAELSWRMYHHKNTSAPETDHLKLDTDDGTADDDSMWNDTSPTSSVFSLKTSTSVNGSSDDYIAYVFTAKQGYSKFGYYTGNANADGPFVFLGFRPAWIMLKRTDNNGQSWSIFDYKRDGYNVDNDTLYADTNDAEATTDVLDFLSNGFKIRANRTDSNASGANYIYLAFAEAPFVNSNGVPCNAR